MPRQVEACAECEALNSISAEHCQECGESFGHKFTLHLTSALRVGGIVRGGDFEEEEFQEGEEIADEFREFAVRTGDQFILKLARVAPDESLGRLTAFAAEIKRSRATS